jgi:DNA-directed RNA polymerase subunit RPC12/RpoP
MEATEYDCPRCGSEIKRLDQYIGCKLSCRDCGYRLSGFFSKVYVKISSFLKEGSACE